MFGRQRRLWPLFWILPPDVYSLVQLLVKQSAVPTLPLVLLRFWQCLLLPFFKGAGFSACTCVHLLHSFFFSWRSGPQGTFTAIALRPLSWSNEWSVQASPSLVILDVSSLRPSEGVPWLWYHNKLLLHGVAQVVGSWRALVMFASETSPASLAEKVLDKVSSQSSSLPDTRYTLV